MSSSTASASQPPLPDLLLPDTHAPQSAVIDAAQAAVDADSAAPGLQPIPVPIFHSLRAGCWLLSYRPTGSPLVAYDGTMRVESHSAGRTASGDLYQRPIIVLPPPHPVPLLGAGPNPASGIPVLARSRYRYYLRVTALPETIFVGSSFTLRFEMWRFTAPNTWVKESELTAGMTRMPAPPGYPSSPDYAEGNVKTAAGAVVGRLTMGWLSSYFRRCTVEIDTVAQSEQPTQSGAGHTWRTVMDAVGWQVGVNLSDTNVAQPSGVSWSDSEMHAAMLARRAATNLDTEWRYHVLAVKNIDSTPRGIMYDAGGTDSNNVPREGIGIASHWIIDPGWGTVSGLRFGTAAAPYFRTAVHEVGHAMGLYHNTADHGFMCTSDVIAAAGTAASPFPSNIQWSFHPTNLKQLRHYPDPFVRPGSVAFGSASSTTPAITPTDLEVDVDGLALSVEPLLGELPLGAPVRVEITLQNQGDRAQRVPANLSLKGEFVSGTVTDPTGTARSFRTVVHCVEDAPYQLLAAGESLHGSMTLMRGAEGALFGVPGVHDVQVDVHWELAGVTAHVAGRASVMVTATVDKTHAKAAHRVLATPDAHLVLAIGGDHLTDGMVAIDAALQCPTLRPHFASIEAKRIGRRFGARKPDIPAAAALIDDSTVMSGGEVDKMAALLGSTIGKQAKPRGKGLPAPEQAAMAED